MNNQLTINEETFDPITNDILEVGKNLSSSLFPAYNLALESEEVISKLEKENSKNLLNTFNFYKISECKIYEIDDKFNYFVEKLQSLFTAAYSIKKEICYGFISKNNTVSFVIGIDPTSKDNDMKKFISGFLPGTTLEKFNTNFSINENKNRFVGSISGVPVLDRDKNIKEKDFSNLIRALNGQDYSILIMARPISNQEISEKIQIISNDYDKIAPLAEKSVSIQEGTSHSDSTGESQSQENKGLLEQIFSVVDNIVPLLYFIPPAIPYLGAYTFVRGVQKNITNKGTYSTNKSTTDSKSNSISSSTKQFNIFAKRFAKVLEKSLDRLEIGKNIGMWESVISYSSDSKLASQMIEGTIYNNISSTSPEALFPLSISYTDKTQELMIPKGFFNNKPLNEDNNWTSIVTSEELAISAPIPISNIHGFQYREVKQYPINYHISENEINLGLVCEYDKALESIPFGLSEYDLNKHTFVTGITGCGKTNTVKNILENVNKPFLVIEPAKTEYRNLNNVNVYTLGRPAINSLQINPFYIPMGVSPQHHIDLLKELFNASFALYGPMPYILEKCLNNIYLKKGWNLTLGLHPHSIKTKNSKNLFNKDNIENLYNNSSHKYLFPTMQDLKDEIDYYINNKMTYDSEIKGNIQSAIKARIDSLCIGSKGFMFNTYNTPDFKTLLEQNTVLELEGLSDDSDKAFTLGLLIIYINEYRQVNKKIDSSNGLKHLLVIEEAHRLLKNVSSETSQDLGNPKGKAVEHFTNILAEMRSYGQGVIVAEQIPTKLTPDVIKNSSNKIIHRLVAKDDQEIIASTIGLNIQDAIHIGNQKVGHALCHKEGMAEPILVKFNKIPEENITLDYKLFNTNIDSSLFEINKNELKAHLSKEINNHSIKILTDILYKPTASSIESTLEKTYQIFEKLIIKNNIQISPMNIPLSDVVLDCLFDSIKSNLVSGTLSSNSLPDDKLLKQIYRVLYYNKENDIVNLYDSLKKFYSRIPENKIIELLASLVIDEYIKQYDLKKYISDFSNNNIEILTSDVKEYLDNKYKKIYERRKL